MKKQAQDATARFEKAIREPKKKKNYVLRLYVAGTTAGSARAIANVRKICEEHLKGHYHLEVVDLYQQPELAHGEQIIAAPTLIKELPVPVRRVLGDMSKTQRVLVVLGIKPGSGGALAGAE